MNRQAVQGVLEALNDLSIPHMLVGSLASSAYGVARSTQDADIVVDLGSTPISAIVLRLGPEYLPNTQTTLEQNLGSGRFDLRHVPTRFKIELFLLTDDPHDRERFRRRRQGTVMGRTTWLPTPEDVIITKLRWSRLGKRTKDIDDAKNVIAVQTKGLDWDYVYRWCDAHGTRDLLEDVRKSIPEGML